MMMILQWVKRALFISSEMTETEAEVRELTRGNTATAIHAADTLVASNEDLNNLAKKMTEAAQE